MDLHSRRIIGWALRETLDASLVTETLDCAFGCRSVNLDELMIHTDQGRRYTGKEFQKRLVDKKIKSSMSGKGNCWDNAVVESFFATLKDELDILDRLIQGPEQLFSDLWMWIEGCHNRKRGHPAIGYFAPIDVEERHLQRAKLLVMTLCDLFTALGQSQTGGIAHGCDSCKRWTASAAGSGPDLQPHGEPEHAPA